MDLIYALLGAAAMCGLAIMSFALRRGNGR